MHAKSKLRPFVEGMLGAPLFDKEADNFDFEKAGAGKSYLIGKMHTREYQLNLNGHTLLL